MNKKKHPKNTDNFQLIETMTGSLSAKNPQTKNSIYESAEEEIIYSEIFDISFYASFYPFQ